MATIDVGAGMILMMMAMMFVWLIGLVLSVAGFIFWILMLVDCVKRRMDSNEKIVWVLILVFTNIIGALAYYFMVKRPARRR